MTTLTFTTAQRQQANKCILDNVDPIPADFDITGHYPFDTEMARIARVLKGEYLIVSLEDEKLVTHHSILFTKEAFEWYPGIIFDTVLYAAGPLEALALMWESRDYETSNVIHETDTLKDIREVDTYDDDSPRQFAVKDLMEYPTEVDKYILASHMTNFLMDIIKGCFTQVMNRAVFEFLDDARKNQPTF